ncbi:MAG TPA: DUF2007 domain-containing protein [Terriglobales bacterium]
MSVIQDPYERLRLERLYRSMSDEELRQLASTPDEELTDDAQDALDEELDRRGIDIPPAPIPEVTPEPQLSKLITIAKFRDTPEALLAKGALESAGIECFLGDDNVVRLDWFISNFIGGIKLRVHEEDEEAARQILAQEPEPSYEVEGIGTYEMPRCPQCNSLNVHYEDFDKSVALVSLAVLKLPIRIANKLWTCNDCGARWRVEPETGSTEVQD